MGGGDGGANGFPANPVGPRRARACVRVCVRGGQIGVGVRAVRSPIRGVAADGRRGRCGEVCAARGRRRRPRGKNNRDCVNKR